MTEHFVHMSAIAVATGNSITSPIEIAQKISTKREIDTIIFHNHTHVRDHGRPISLD
jgi:hypothetical protein